MVNKYVVQFSVIFVSFFAATSFASTNESPTEEKTQHKKPQPDRELADPRHSEKESPAVVSFIIAYRATDKV